ncbi:MAG: imidazole glycerol phosphate synthase subunit HisH [Phycisphaerae bacterium]|jgi:glutamine amidotransferase|nr:imidazole glycerol phosphate synthase subunit HisH [Phycisphaerae bacterium]
MIAIVDYNMGNVGSIRNMLRKIGAESVITSDVDEISRASKLILPGVGAFDTGMTHIKQMGLLDVLNEMVLERKVPVLGICLGMQLITRRSAEGELPGLGWIQADTVRFDFDHQTEDAKIPHMGWNVARPRHCDTLFKGLEDQEDTAFYFVHSYHVLCDDEADVLAAATHGYEFTCAIEKGNILATQFHPEKSHRYGMQLLKNFVEMF